MSILANARSLVKAFDDRHQPRADLAAVDSIRHDQLAEMKPKARIGDIGIAEYSAARQIVFQ